MLDRLATIRGSRVWNESGDPELVYCELWYLILFACKDRGTGQCADVLELLDDILPKWTRDKRFVRYVDAQEEFDFFRVRSAWSTRIGKPQASVAITRAKASRPDNVSEAQRAPVPVLSGA